MVCVMKYIVSIFIICSIYSSLTLAQEGWFEQTFDTTLHFNSVCFVNENVGWIYGSRTLAKTYDGGETWIFIDSEIEFE